MNFHNGTWIYSKLKRHFEYANQHIADRNIIGVFLHGSQNYGLDIETSDVDSVCLVMPSLDDILKAKEPYSSELTIQDENEKIVIWEIRKFINLLEKGGFNQLEILYTNYFVLNDTYTSLWQYITSKRKSFVYLNSKRTANSFVGMINRCIREIKKDGKNYLKEYMRVEFFYQILKGYLDHEDFANLINPSNADELKKIRESKITKKCCY